MANVDEVLSANPFRRLSIEAVVIIFIQIVACIVWGVHVDAYNGQQDIRIQENKDNIAAINAEVRQISQNNSATSEHLARLDEQLTSINGKVTDIHDQFFTTSATRHGPRN